MNDEIDPSTCASICELLARVDDIARAHEDARKLYVDRLSPDFRVFEFINTAEMGLSRIIAWLLKPDGTHGQGSLFLEFFFNCN